MNRRLEVAVAAAIISITLPAQSAPDGAAPVHIDIRFENAGRYTDAGDSFAGTTDDGVLKELAAHLRRTAAPCIPETERLSITITDIDLAGRMEWGNKRRSSPVRVLRGVTWPRIDLAYSLSGSQGTIQSDRASIADQAYLSHSRFLSTRDEPLAYEKLMLSGWMRSTFCKRDAERSGDLGQGIAQ